MRRNVVRYSIPRRCSIARGISKWLRIIAEPVGEDVAVTFVDVTDRKAKEMQMESIAWSDPLTGVLNRRGFERDAASRLSESSDDATGALLFIDLNEFKQINDRCGHEIGDQLLVIAAERLRTSLRSIDIIGRPGGDEFVALVPDVNAKVAETLASRLARSLEEPYLIGTESLYCAASIGLALYPDNANTLTGLLRAADQAMYRAKARCRGVTNIRQRDLLEKRGRPIFPGSGTLKNRSDPFLLDFPLTLRPLAESGATALASGSSRQGHRFFPVGDANRTQ